MLFNIDEKQLMLELKNKDERALKICMNKYYRYVVYIVENIIGSALPYEDKEAVVSNVFMFCHLMISLGVISRILKSLKYGSIFVFMICSFVHQVLYLIFGFTSAS